MRGVEPWYEAAQVGDIEVLERLVFAGANPNQQNPHGWTALHWAAARGHTDVVKYLLNLPGIQVRIKNAHGQTPEDIADWNKRGKIKRLLLAASSEEE